MLTLSPALALLLLQAPDPQVHVRVLLGIDGNDVARVAGELHADLSLDPRLQVDDQVTAARPAPSSRQEDLQTAAEHVSQARQAYAQLDPQAALGHVASAESLLRAYTDQQPVPTALAEALRLRGLTLLFLSRAEPAARSFAAAAALDPAFSPGAEDWPPEARLAYADAVAAGKRASPGSLSIRVAPEAAVIWLDGRRLGSGSTTISEVLPGEHYLLAACPGHRRFAGVVSVEGAGKLAEASVFLEPQEGTLRDAAATAELWAALRTDLEQEVAGQVAAVLGVDALVLVGPGTRPDAEDVPNLEAWVLGNTRDVIPIRDRQQAAAEVSAALLRSTPLQGVAAPPPWYLSWKTWAVAGAVVAGAAAAFVAFGGDDTDRVSFFIGRAQ